MGFVVLVVHGHEIWNWDYDQIGRNLEKLRGGGVDVSYFFFIFIFHFISFFISKRKCTDGSSWVATLQRKQSVR